MTIYMLFEKYNMIAKKLYDINTHRPMTHTANDLLELLNRYGQLLARLVEAPTDVPTLTEEMSVSRPTVQRALTAFEDWELITPEEERFEATLFARLVLTVYDDFAAEVTTAQTTDGTPLCRTTSERADALTLLVNRRALLECAQTPCDKRTLVAELPISRSTINWAVRELEQAGLIERTADGYTTTSIGEWATAQYRSLLETLTDLLDAQDLLAHLPPDCGFTPTLLTGADIERADTAIPYRSPTVRERLDIANRIHAILPALPNPQLLDVCHQDRKSVV